MNGTMHRIRNGAPLFALALALFLGSSLPAFAASSVPTVHRATLTGVDPVKPITPIQPGNNPPQQNPSPPSYNPGENPGTGDPGIEPPPDTFTPSDPSIFQDLLPAEEELLPAEEDLIWLLPLLSGYPDPYLTNPISGGYGSGNTCTGVATASVGGSYANSTRFGNHHYRGVTPLMIYNGC